jgi:Cytosol aminopeptidase family, N-terminal domain
MELRFLPPDLRRLDTASVELCACSIWSDERPVRGFAGLIDWRLGGRISGLLKSGFFRGELGEALLVPGKPHVPFEKVLLIGLGPRSAFGEDRFREGVLHIATALERMRVRRAVVELPGRGCAAIEPEPAITLALECAGASPDHDVWWLVEPPADQKRTELRAAEERRRIRSA